MKYWIFKLVWIPSFVVVLICCTGIAIYLFKEIGWEQPYRWLCLIAFLGYIADKAINS